MGRLSRAPRSRRVLALTTAITIFARTKPNMSAGDVPVKLSVYNSHVKSIFKLVAGNAILGNTAIISIVGDNAIFKEIIENF